MENEKAITKELMRTIDWKQGLAIALGVPLLILPSIGYFTGYVGAFAIVVWMLSVCQGFLQNLAYGEMATMFPDASGLPGFAQKIFRSSNNHTRFDIGNFVGGFSAWSYWFAWNPVLAIFSLLIGGYLHGLIPALAEISEFQLSLVAGITIFIILIAINYRGLSSGAILGYILAVISLAPLIIIALAPFLTGSFEVSNITANWLPDEWEWDVNHGLILLGIFAMAQWSACAWETAAIYGPEYKNPKVDVPKALFFCGAICIITFILVQVACTGTIGVKGIMDEPFSPMMSVAKKTLGPIGVNISIFMLITAMVLIIQTAFLGSARAMYSMASEGNLPKLFGRTNRHGTPVIAMISIAIFNIGLISLKTPSAIVAASSIGYVFANGISLLAYVKAKSGKRYSDLENTFRAPRGWKYVAGALSIFNLPLCLVGVIYLNSLDVGWQSTWVGFIVLSSYLPLWYYSQRVSTEMQKMDCIEFSAAKR